MIIVGFFSNPLVAGILTTKLPALSTFVGKLRVFAYFSII